MVKVFSVISKNLFNEVTNKFKKKLELPNGLVKYWYYGDSIINKPKWESVFFSKDNILGGDIMDLYNNTYTCKKNSIRELLSLRNFVVIEVELDDEDKYGSDIVLTKLGHCDSLEEAISIMDFYDPNNEVKISFNTSLEFAFNFIMCDKDLNRNIVTEGARLYNYGSHLILKTNHEIVNHDEFKVNINNIKRVNSIDIRTIFTDVYLASIDNVEIKKELAIINIEYLCNVYGGIVYYGQLRDCLSIFSDEDKLDIADRVMSIIPNKLLHELLFTIFTLEFVNDNPEAFADKLYSAKYNYNIISFFIKNKDNIDITRIDKKRFIKASSLSKYNELAQYDLDPKIIYMADSINSAGTILNERIVTLACFVNMYSKDEFKELDINPLADAIVNKLVARFSYELNTNILPVIDKNNPNMQYLCDKVIERMVDSSCNSMSRIKLIKENTTRDRSSYECIFDYLSRSVDRSDSNKVMKALLKLNI